MMNLDYPFHFDSRGRTAATGDADHVRDMIEQFLFTRPQERVNRPDFGAGLLSKVFEPNSQHEAVALQFMIQAGLQRWLGDLAEVRGLEVVSRDGTLSVDVAYALRNGDAPATASFPKERGDAA